MKMFGMNRIQGYLLMVLMTGCLPVLGQITYLPIDGAREVGMGVDRVAKSYLPPYESEIAASDDEIRWFQVDLGEKRKIDGIKMLPVVKGNFFQSWGFPARFMIEISDVPEMKPSILYEEWSSQDFRDPVNEVVTFGGKQVYGRYVRLTATRLRQRRLSLSKFMVMSEGKDIAQGCTVTDPVKGEMKVCLLTRPPRPQGEGVVTNNPENLIPEEKWTPVAYKAQSPKGNIKMGEGLFKKAMENNIEYLMSSFTFDELVRNYYLKGGKPVEPLHPRLRKFWFLELPGQEAGRFLMGAGNTLRWMEDRDLRERMNRIVDVIDECKESDGYLMAYPKNRVFTCENGAYVRSWITHGLIEAGFAGNEKAFRLLRGYYDWFNTSCYLPEILRRSGQGTQGLIPSTRTYFTPVGKPEDLKVVQQYMQENYWLEQLSLRNPEAIWLYPYDRPHGYLVTALEPYLDLYRATGEKKYLDAVLGGWDLYHDHWQHVGGAISICENPGFFPPGSNYLHRSPTRRYNGELCASVFWSFLNQRFHLLYPEEEKYVSEIEKSIYNVLLANQSGTKGFRYFAILVDHKDLNTDTIPNGHLHCMSTCCEGQGTRMAGALPEFIYSVADDGIFVDLFSSSAITFKTGSQDLTLQMETQFPFEPGVELRIHASKPVHSKIRIRVPSWAARKMTVKLNGKGSLKGDPGTYVILDRQWKDGDVISFTLPAGFRMTEYQGDEKEYHGHYALEYGPVLMAFVNVRGDKDNLKSPVSPEKLIGALKSIPGKPLHFRVEGYDDYEYMPYLEVQDEPFTCFP